MNIHPVVIGKSENNPYIKNIVDKKAFAPNQSRIICQIWLMTGNPALTVWPGWLDKVCSFEVLLLLKMNREWWFRDSIKNEFFFICFSKLRISSMIFLALNQIWSEIYLFWIGRSYKCIKLFSRKFFET